MVELDQTSFVLFHPKVNFAQLNLSQVDLTSSLQNIILDMRPLIERGREYSYLAASVLSESLRTEMLSTLQLPSQVSHKSEDKKDYPTLSQCGVRYSPLGLNESKYQSCLLWGYDSTALPQSRV